jgi:plasmid stabilization system protein ParE
VAKRTVVWTETAVKQRREILKYWLVRNKSAKYPEKLTRLIAARIKVIQTDPGAFKLTSFPETRISAMGHFSILYKFTPNQIIVTAFWDNRQDPAKLLLLLNGK